MIITQNYIFQGANNEILRFSIAKNTEKKQARFKKLFKNA